MLRAMKRILSDPFHLCGAGSGRIRFIRALPDPGWCQKPVGNSHTKKRPSYKNIFFLLQESLFILIHMNNKLIYKTKIILMNIIFLWKIIKKKSWIFTKQILNSFIVFITGLSLYYYINQSGT